eukprot:403354960
MQMNNYMSHRAGREDPVSSSSDQKDQIKKRFAKLKKRCKYGENKKQARISRKFYQSNEQSFNQIQIPKCKQIFE